MNKNEALSEIPYGKKECIVTTLSKRSHYTYKIEPGYEPSFEIWRDEDYLGYVSFPLTAIEMSYGAIAGQIPWYVELWFEGEKTMFTFVLLNKMYWKLEFPGKCYIVVLRRPVA